MNLPELAKLYEVRQTFGAFGCGCKETFKTQPETEAYGRVIVEGSQGSFTTVPAIMPTSLIATKDARIPIDMPRFVYDSLKIPELIATPMAEVGVSGFAER